MIVLARHGRTAHNAGGRLLGHLDPPLDGLGERQAVALGGALARSGLRDPRVVTSPLVRTAQTAAAIAGGLGVAAPTVDRSWIELDYGAWDGVALTEVPRETWAAWRADTGFRPPGGETLVELGVRVRAALDGLAVESQKRDIVVVSHVSPIKAAVTWALGVGDEIVWRLFLAPASITRIRPGPVGATVVTFNDTAHVAQLEREPPRGSATTPR